MGLLKVIKNLKRLFLFLHCKLSIDIQKVTMICFLDRDGIINIDYGYVGSIKNFEWCEGIFELLIKLKTLGYRMVLITNQSGINRGYFTYSEFLDLTFYMINFLEKMGIDIEINFCRHHPNENCNCRKPSPNMILRYEISSEDIFIGDKDSDMIAAKLAGIQNRWIISELPKGPFTNAFKNHYELINFVNVNTIF